VDGPLPAGQGPTSKLFCAPQLYLIGGFNEAAASRDAQAEVQLLDASLGAETHFFTYDQPQFGPDGTSPTYLASLLDGRNVPNNMPIDLMGISFGGGVAASVAWDLASLGDCVSYLSLIDPVAPYDGVYTGRVPAHEAVFDTEDANALNPPHADHAQDPYSTFDMPRRVRRGTYGVIADDVWFAPYHTEYNYPLPGFGPIAPPTPQENSALLDYHVDGLYHTSQFFAPTQQRHPQSAIKSFRLQLDGSQLYQWQASAI
jgi:hypothetical protein